jgi:hypothetical protein
MNHKSRRYTNRSAVRVHNPREGRKLCRSAASPVPSQPAPRAGDLVICVVVQGESLRRPGGNVARP